MKDSPSFFLLRRRKLMKSHLLPDLSFYVKQQPNEKKLIFHGNKQENREKLFGGGKLKVKMFFFFVLT